MAIPSSLSLNYDALLSTTLFNVRRELVDNIATSNALLYHIMKMDGTYKSNSSIGERLMAPLMYELGSADSYSGYDVLDTTPMDGITAAFFDWRQFAAHVSISGEEEKKNKGENAIVKLLSSKTKQAVMGIKESFSKAMIRGNLVNSGNFYEAYVSPDNGSTFIDPLFKLVDIDPDRNQAVGNINPSTYSWWNNQHTESTTASTATFAQLLKELRHLYNNCSKGPGGPPNLLIAEQQTFELYEAALTTYHRNTTWTKADIPFDNVAFRGKPMVWDEFMFDPYSASTTITYGTVVMLNTQFFGIEYESGTNFTPQGFVKPDNQDAKVNHILWMGAMSIDNRRKHGVLDKINLAVAS